MYLVFAGGSGGFKSSPHFLDCLLAPPSFTRYSGDMAQDDDTLVKIAQHLSVIQTYLSKVTVLVAEYQSATAQNGTVRSTNTTIHSLHMWAEHLAANGPTARGDITAATGLNLTKSGYDRTHAWVGPMTYMPDDGFPADAVLRIKGPSNGVGRPPVIFFLWSQRWDVLPKFGVGPVQPDVLPETVDLGQQYLDTVTAPMDLTAEDEVALADLLTGDGDSVRYATMDEWDDAWSATFDALAAAEAKPSDEVKQRMRDTLPDGADGNAAIAIAYRQATLRLREPQTLLGVIQPPVASPHALVDGPWEEQPLDLEPEPEPDRSGWTMVGNHNHLEHSWSSLCEISQCVRTNG